MYYVSLPLRVPDPGEIDDVLYGYRIVAVSTEVISGYEARCYQLESTPRPLTRIRSCYTADGVEAAYEYYDDAGGTKRRLVRVEEVSEDDFTPPFPTIAD